MGQSAAGQPDQESVPAAMKQPAAERAGSKSPDDLPDIPGLDTTLGLKRLWEEGLLSRHAEMYIGNQGEAPAEIRQSLDGGDYETAQRLAHTAKGVSGNIGATTFRNWRRGWRRPLESMLPRDD